MNIETDNAFSALSSDESEEVISTSSHQHGQPAVATIPPISRSVTMREEQEQLEAEYTAMQERMQQMRLASLQQRNDAMRAELDAAERQAAAMSSSSLYHSTPITAVHQPAPPINRHLFTGVRYASAINSPISAAALAKRQSIARLPSFLPAVDPSVHISPAPPAPPVHIKHTPPIKFTGDKDAQNADVEQWIDEANIYLDLSHVAPQQHLKEVTGLLSGYALKWLKEKREEVQAVGKIMTWEWLQSQLIEDFGRSTGQLAERAEWLALKMGTKNTDGSETGGKSTYTVKAYSSHFTRLMRALTEHTSLTHDIAIVDRYCEGIRIGYAALWDEMKGVHAVLSYDTLADAITGAQVAESALAVLKAQHSSSSNHRARHTHANNMQSSTDDSPSPPRSPVRRRRERKQPTLTAYGFVYRPVTEEGRYKLSEAQQKLLYDESRCYHCYQPRHPKMNTCPKKMTVAPVPLN